MKKSEKLYDLLKIAEEKRRDAWERFKHAQLTFEYYKDRLDAEVENLEVCEKTQESLFTEYNDALLMEE